MAIRMYEYSVELFICELRWVCLLWRGEQLARLSFYHASEKSAMKTVASEAEIAFSRKRRQSTLSRHITRYAAGNRVSFCDIQTSAAGTIFQNKVLGCCQQIPYGCTMTYGEVAMKVGHPGAARAVGNVMRNNPCPLVIPCHRVLGSNGKLTGFSAGSGLELKLQLLRMEGINRKFVF